MSFHRVARRFYRQEAARLDPRIARALPREWTPALRRINPVWALMGANGLVWLYYQQAQYKWKTQGDPSGVLFMNRHFSAHAANAVERPWSLVLASFTHLSGSHFLFNMLALHTFGSLVHGMLGPRALFTTYLGAGLAASAAHIAIQRYQLSRRRSKQLPPPPSRFGLRTRAPLSAMPQERGAIGASGSILGLGTLVACLNPKLPLHLYGILPVPVWILIGGYVAYDFYSVTSDRKSVISHSSHLGGALYGGAIYLLMRRARRGRW